MPNVIPSRYYRLIENTILESTDSFLSSNDYVEFVVRMAGALQNERFNEKSFLINCGVCPEYLEKIVPNRDGRCSLCGNHKGT